MGRGMQLSLTIFGSNSPGNSCIIVLDEPICGLPSARVGSEEASWH
jgi:hypothetical protein